MSGPGEAAMAVDQAQQVRTGAEVQAFNKRLVQELSNLVKDIELRKWAVDKTVELAKTADGDFDFHGHLKLVYAFVTAPIGERTE